MKHHLMQETSQNVIVRNDFSDYIIKSHFSLEKHAASDVGQPGA